MNLYGRRDDQYYEDLQWKLEQEYDHEAVRRYIKERTERLASGDAANDPLVQNIIRSAFKFVENYFIEECAKRDRGTAAKYRQVLRAVPTDTLTATTLSYVLGLCTLYTLGDEGITFQRLARTVGVNIVTELKIEQATKVNPVYMRRVHEDLDSRNASSPRFRRGVYSKAYQTVMGDSADITFSNIDLIHIGKFGVDACYQAGLIVDNRHYDKRGTVVYYELAPNVRDYILNSDSKALIRHISSNAYRKMVCEPDPWVNATGGGYLTPRRKERSRLISIKNTPPKKVKEYLSRFTDEAMPMIFRVANYLQSVPYTYHTPTVDLIRKVWEAGGGFLGIPKKEYGEKPQYPFDKDWVEADATPEEQQILRKWKREASAYYLGRKRHRSIVWKTWDLIRGVSIGETDKFWFPVFMCKRGRWYYDANPNPQGGDIEKAVLHFADRKPLGESGIYWLKVHIANCLGVDDIRFDKRVEYVDSVWADLVRGLENPLDEYEVFGKEAPLMTYAACYELHKALQLPNPAEYYTGIPVHMDATVSGTQHFSALLRDEHGAKYTNLIDLLGEKKADMYKAVAEATLEAIRCDFNNGVEVEAARVWLNLGIPRDLAKKPCMTYTYGVTLFTTQDYIYDWLDDEYPELARELPKSTITYLAKKLFEGIEATIPATVKGMDYLRSVGQELGSNVMSWTNPSTGMYVEHTYYRSEDKRVKVNSAGLTLVVVRSPTDTLRKGGMTSALAPNFIHSLDAAHLTLVADEFRERGLSLVGIHDSFGTHPCDVGVMHEIIRDKFIELYKHDHLALFKESVNSKVPLPEYGVLDLEQVRDSEFFFC